MTHEYSRRGRRSRIALVASLVALATPASLEAQAERSHLGLPASGGLGIHVGGGRLERSSEGIEAGATLDLGWLHGRGVRLQAEVAFVRAQLTEYVEVNDSTYRGRYFDLSAGVSAVWFRDADASFTPYALAGTSVHALSSAFGTLALDRRYNTNRFGSQVGVGLRLRTSQRRAWFVEARRVIADETDRTVVRLGATLLLGDQARR